MPNSVQEKGTGTGDNLLERGVEPPWFTGEGGSASAGGAASVRYYNYHTQVGSSLVLRHRP